MAQAPAKFDMTDAVPINPQGSGGQAPAKFDMSDAVPVEASFAPEEGNTEGTYDMVGANGKSTKVPYSKIGDASKAGYKLSEADRRRYVNDAIADKNLNKDKNLPEGVKVAGKNAAGQDILAPTSPTDGSALSRFASAEYGGLKDAAKGVVDFLNPNPSEAEKQAGRTSTYDILTRYPNRVVQPNVDMLHQAEDEAAAGDYSAAAEHAIGGAIPLVGPFMAGAVDKGVKAIAGGNIAGAAGGAVADVMVAEAPGVGGELAKGVVRGAKAVIPTRPVGAFVDAVTRTGPREVKRLAEHTEKENADAIAAAKKVNDDRAEAHLGKTIDAVQEAHKHSQKEGFRSDEVERKNEADRQEFNKKELDRVKAEGEKRLDALKANKDKISDYEQRRERIKKENEANYRREIRQQNLQGKLRAATEKLDTLYQKTFKDATTSYNNTWNSWRDMMTKANAKADMSPTVDVINEQAKSMKPEQVAIFNQILSETAPVDVGTSPAVAGASLNDLVSKKILAGGYKQALNGTLDLSVAPDVIALFHDLKDASGKQLDATKAAHQATASLTEVPAERLHTWKSQLERAVRTTSDGAVRHAIGQVLDQVRKQEADVSASVGPDALKQLTKARSITGPYFDAFFKSPDELPKAAGQSLREQNSEYVKEKNAQQRLDRIAKYNPEVGAAAKLVANVTQGLEDIARERNIGKRSELPLKPDLKDVPTVAPAGKFQPKEFTPTPGAKSGVVPNRPPEEIAETKTLSRQDLTNWKKNNVKATAQRIRDLALSRSLYAAMTGIPISIATFFMGHPIAAALEASSPASVIAFSSGVANLLEKPGVVEYLSRVTDKDVAAYEKMPPKEKALFKDDMGEVVKVAKKNGATISPVLSAFIASPTITPRKKKPTPQEMLQQAHQNLQTGFYNSGFGGNQ